jgi:hypothetical protein
LRLGGVAKRLLLGLLPQPQSLFFSMYICYVDESGTSDIPGNTSHFVLAGLSIPIEKWKECDIQVDSIRATYGISEHEVHVAWLLRTYLEQSKIKNFSTLDWTEREIVLTRCGRPKSCGSSSPSTATSTVRSRRIAGRRTSTSTSPMRKEDSSRQIWLAASHPGTSFNSSQSASTKCTSIRGLPARLLLSRLSSK